MWNAKQEFPCQSLESFSEEYNNMENKIVNFLSGPVCTNQTRPVGSYSIGSDQDDAEIQHDRWSTQKWSNREKSEKMSTS